MCAFLQVSCLLISTRILAGNHGATDAEETHVGAARVGLHMTDE